MPPCPRFSPSGGALLYSSYLGGTAPGSDGAYHIASSGPGIVSVTGATGSEDFPTTPGAYDTTLNAGGDVFVATLRVALPPRLSQWRRLPARPLRA